MQKKRVRVYKPDNSKKFMYELGGAADTMGQQPMVSSNSQGPDLQQVVMSYAQAKGMSQEETAQMYQQIAQMPVEQQQETINMLVQELSASAPGPVAKNGGDISNMKRLLKKKIGGVGPNVTAQNIVENNAQSIMNTIGGHMARKLIDDTAKEAEEKIMSAQSYSPVQNTFAVGGAYDPYPFRSEMDPMDSPFVQNYLQGQNNLQSSVKDFTESLGDLGRSFTYAGKKIKVRGDMFNPKKAGKFNNPAYVNPYNLGPTGDEAAQQMFGLKNGGSLPYMQNAGTYDPNVGYSTTLQDAKNRYGQYNITDYAGLMNLYNQGKLPMHDFYDVADAFGIMVPNNAGPGSTGVNTATNTNTTTNTTTNTNTPQTGALNGWYGGFFFKDGQIVTAAPGSQGAGTQGFNPGMMYRRAGDMLNGMSKEEIKAMGNAFNSFQPDNVYLSKAKSRVSPFGSSTTFKWNYGEDPDADTDADGDVNADMDNDSDGRLGYTGRRGQARRDARMSEDRFAAKNARRAERRGWNDDDMSTDMSTDISTGVTTSGGGSGIGSMERQDNTYNSPTSNPRVNNAPAQRMPNANGLMIPGPNDFMDNYEVGGMAKGGMAGKLKIKDVFSAPGMSVAETMLTGANALSNVMNQTSLNDNFFMPDNTQFALSDSWDQNPMNRGGWAEGMGITGEYAPHLQPFSQAGRFAQGSGNLLAGNLPYNEMYNRGPFRKDGGATYEYELGGTYDLDDDELDNLLASGASVEYFDED